MEEVESSLHWPFRISKRVGEIAYRLDLPLELSIVHNVFYVSMLRKYLTGASQVIPVQPEEL